MNIPVIYEDNNLVAVNKPAGLVVHEDGKTRAATLVDWILENYPEIKNVGEQLVSTSGEQIHRPGIVHRLDKDTSGIMLIAKTESAYLHFKKQFQEHKIIKIYKTIVYGRIKDGDGVIDKPIARSPKDFRQRSAEKNARGKARESITEYRVIANNENYSYLEVSPKTGRTHQIRVHLKSIGHPVICDSLYAPKRECPKELGRLALHAFSIEFMTLEETKMLLEAPLPDDIGSLARNLFPALRDA